ncbi:hypothetical protein GCM10010435_14560 [Winogradskya consettensis]|uniref:Peptidase S1 domain-containing protein n=1 Tax=Winogradskya consettensis TaxID=113560 RepID=A0A919SCC7_9ACTN|nr:LamG-like jellyroll fold domain-containing protein [Actinoplanes consettensis]GIM69124.1 hypothetical protein Aco04nite_13830 [Actinoplanes consettensis]
MEHNSGRRGAARLRLAGAVLIAASTVAAAATPAFAVAGGEAAATGAYPFVVKLDVGDGIQTCSGALIAPEWAITATECLGTGSTPVATGRPTVPITAMLGRTELAGSGGQVRSVVRVVPHASRGVALVRFASPVTGITPVALATAQPATDATVRVAGYGRTTTAWIPGALQSAQFTVATTSATGFTVTSAAAAACRGDAGAPAFTESADGVRLAGVSTTSGQSGCFGETATGNTAEELRVDDLATWVQQSVAQDQPAGRWDLRETSGTALADSTTAGTAHPATVSGATLGQAGPVLGGDTAVRFDGVNDYAATGAAVVNTAADYSVSAWVRVSALSTGYTNAVAANGTRTSVFGLGKSSGNKWVFWVHPTDSDNGGGLVEVVATTGPKVGSWAHLAGVFTAADRKLTLYVNGVAAGSATMTSAPWNATGTVNIGRGLYAGTGGYYWAGDLSSVKIWNRALAATELGAQAGIGAGRWSLQDTGVDSSGFERRLSAAGDVDYTDGRVRDSALFNGADQVLATSAPVLRTDQSFTVSAWVRADKLSTGYTNAVAQDGTRTTMFGLGKSSTNKWTFWTHSADSDSGGTLVSVTAASGPTVGTWAHLTGVYDANNNKITLYVNGAPAGSTALTTVWHAGSRLTIGGGRWVAANGYFWPGSVDEVRAIQGALTPAEVQSLYTTTPTGTETATGAALAENFAYPGAAKLLADQNVKLLSGDGHIVAINCATAADGDIGLLKVYTTDETIGADGVGRVCFKVLGAPGRLDLEVPGVYEIRGDGQRSGTGHEVTADLTTDEGDELSVDVDPAGSTQVGLGASPDNPPTILLRLTAKG